MSNVTFTPIPEGMAATPSNFNSRFAEIAASLSSAVTVSTGASSGGHAFYATSSDVSHGATHIIPTDVYAYIAKSSSATGGGVFGGTAEIGSSLPGVVLAGTAGQPHTSKSTTFSTSRAIIELQALTHDGAGATTDVDANGNIVMVATRKGGAIQSIWILDEDGDTWQSGNLVLESGGAINFANNDVTITHASNQLTIAGGVLSVGGSVVPTTNDVSALGEPSLSFSDLFLADGGVINFNNSAFSIRHTASGLTFAGGTVTFNNAVTLESTLDHNGAQIGFYGATPTTKPTGVAADAVSIRSALITLGLVSS